ncbi:MAG: hypothetical protein Q9162_005215 [Coniocarpon cinnabarinum]
MPMTLKLRLPISKFSTQLPGNKTGDKQRSDKLQVHKSASLALSNKSSSTTTSSSNILSKALPRAPAPSPDPKAKKHVSFVAYSREKTDPEVLVSRFSPKRRKSRDLLKAASEKVREVDEESVPLVRIDVVRGVRKPEELRRVGDFVQYREVKIATDAAQSILRQQLHLSKAAQRQIITQHEPWELAVTQSNHSASNRIVIIHIFIPASGRNTDAVAEKKTKRSILDALQKLGVKRDDVMVMISNGS